MTQAMPLPTLDFYTRPDCSMCDQARDLLQQVLEDRARRGDPVPRIRTVDLSGRPDLEPTYGPRVPVIAAGAAEIALVSSYQAIARFLDSVVGRLA